MNDISKKRCLPCEAGIPPMQDSAITEAMKQLSSDWKLSADKKSVTRHFSLKNYYKTIAFVNAIAWMAHSENHHPDLAVGYNYCDVTYSTHAIDGLSENDFICASKVDQIFASAL